MDELRFVTQGRYVGILSLLYRPFLYYAVHHHDRDSEVNHRIEPLVQKALANCAGCKAGVVIDHRHHGTWFACRQITTWALLLLAARKSGLITWDQPWHGASVNMDFAHSFQVAIDTLRYWEAESPDVVRAREAIETLRDEMEAH